MISRHPVAEVNAFQIRIRQPREEETPEEQLPSPSQERESAATNEYIKAKDLVKYGCMLGCVGCKARESGMSPRLLTKECRGRLEGNLKGDEEDKQS